MKYAVKFYSQVENPEGVPGTWPAVTIDGPDTLVVPEGFTTMTEAEHTAYVAAHQAEYDAWVEAASSTKLAFKQKLKDRIDAKTDEMIATGMVYGGIQFKMDIEHQMSYKGAYDFRAYISYPYTIKGVGAGYLTFQNEGEFTAFILYGFGFMNEVIRGGWMLKDGLDAMTYAELLAWTDPR